MRLEEHCQESQGLFGERHEEVHRWLDEFAGTPAYGSRHRRVRHHVAGIEAAVQIFGESVRLVALAHIKSDLREEGWRDGLDRLPENEDDYIKMGFW